MKRSLIKKKKKERKEKKKEKPENKIEFWSTCKIWSPSLVLTIIAVFGQDTPSLSFFFTFKMRIIIPTSGLLWIMWHDLWLKFLKTDLETGKT